MSSRPRMMLIAPAQHGDNPASINENGSSHIPASASYQTRDRAAADRTRSPDRASDSKASRDAFARSHFFSVSALARHLIWKYFAPWPDGQFPRKADPAVSQSESSWIVSVIP